MEDEEMWDDDVPGVNVVLSVEIQILIQNFSRRKFHATVK